MDPGTGDPVWQSGLPASQIAVITALELEAAVLRRVFGNVCPAVYVSGPGLGRARATAERAVAQGAAALVNWGLAGGLNGSATTGTLAVPRRLLSADGEWHADPPWQQRVSDLLHERFPLVDAPVFSAESVLTSAAAKAALAASSGAAAVDMESAAVARVAADAGLPCLVLRVIADGPDDALPACAEDLVTDDGRTRLRGLLGIVKAPGQLGALIRLGNSSRIARGRLRQVARVLREPGQ